MGQPKGLLPSTAASRGDADLELPLFTWGTSLDEGFLENLLGHPLVAERARVDGFRVETLETFDWPVLVAAEGETVKGRLYRDLTADDFRRLDAYHGVGEGLYERTVVTVQADEGESEPGFAYLPTERTLSRDRGR